MTAARFAPNKGPVVSAHKPQFRKLQTSPRKTTQIAAKTHDRRKSTQIGAQYYYIERSDALVDLRQG